VIALALILAMWISVRVTLVELDPGAAADQSARSVAAAVHPASPALSRAEAKPGKGSSVISLADNTAWPAVTSAGPDAPWRLAKADPAPNLAPNSAPSPARLAGSSQTLTRMTAPPPAPPLAPPHDMAGPIDLLPELPPAAASPRARQRRWSADAWTLARGGQSAPALAAGAAAYGGSQTGMVVRYDLAPSNRLRPQLYLRAAAALSGTVSDSEGAFGVAVRPVRWVPVALLAELRVQKSSGPARLRPVITAVSQLAPLRLPLRAEGEVYMQVGWVGGRDATAFYDGAAVIEHAALNPAPGAALRLGAGAWSGGQRGAARLDIGPRIELRGAIGKHGSKIGVRVAADWRFRVAGRAEPGSGPAITLSAGF
jgi:hypothetical protein